MNILIAYGSSHGSTAAIAQRLADRLRTGGAEVLAGDVRALPRGLDVAAYDAILVGGRVRGGRYPARVAHFVRRNLAPLRARASAFFSVCLWRVSRLDEHRSASREFPRRFLRSVGWTPDQVEVFAGAFSASRYGRWPLGARLMQAIWRSDLGYLEPDRDRVFTDWSEVDAFADAFRRLAEGRLAREVPAPQVEANA